MRTGRYVAFASVVVALTAAAPAHGVLDAGVAGAQVALRSHGLYRGPIDGVRGPQTNRAVLPAAPAAYSNANFLG